MKICTNIETIDLQSFALKSRITFFLPSSWRWGISVLILFPGALLGFSNFVRSRQIRTCWYNESARDSFQPLAQFVNSMCVQPCFVFFLNCCNRIKQIMREEFFPWESLLEEFFVYWTPPVTEFPFSWWFSLRKWQETLCYVKWGKPALALFQ